jgi:uncharacterized protein YacL
MSKRTIWLIFAAAFAVAGAILGVLAAKVYIDHVNNPQWLSWGIPTPLHPSKEPYVHVPETAQLVAEFACAFGGLLFGLIIWNLIWRELQRLRTQIENMSPQDKVAGIIGLIIGLLITVLIAVSMRFPAWASLATAIVLCYFGVVAALSMKEQFGHYFLDGSAGGKQTSPNLLRPKILDTNVIIDGRIADICKAGFLEGPIYIPRFVLDELQQIADSSDSLKRARGRRGLDILNQMRAEMSLQVETYESAMSNAPEEVDAKLVYLAKELNGSIVTNDYNLNKVAAIQGIKVLNVNELANALKPVVLPGEEMVVTIVKEGKESNQGVGYLDDGTMIVVERGRRNMGETVNVIVTSILQTAAGKMIFANIRQDSGPAEEEEDIERSVRGYSGGRPRRKIR